VSLFAAPRLDAPAVGVMTALSTRVALAQLVGVRFGRERLRRELEREAVRDALLTDVTTRHERPHVGRDQLT
jgi:hypothetical protein